MTGMDYSLPLGLFQVSSVTARLGELRFALLDQVADAFAKSVAAGRVNPPAA